MKTYIIVLLIILMLLILNSNQSESDTTTGATSNYNISPAIVNKVNTFSNIISSIAQGRDIPERRIKAHIAVESAGNPDALGSAGEVGLMQMKPTALQDVNQRYLPNAPFKLTDLWEPNNAIAAGTAYLQILYDQLGSLDRASKAYQCGAGNIDTADNIYLNKVLTAEKLF
ncbi:MAG: transglycosylase SLT domain-containing protein [Bacteroidota bacterium]|jgi:soluble lytic murein transglycosylase-like protein